MDRFSLEEQILDCWGICDDIQTIISSTDRSPLTEDELLNILIGLKSLYQMKFETLFDTFEYLLKERKIVY